jgi:hypothetical protein
MISEQIKNEISSQVKNYFDDEINLFNLPLKSQYKVLMFTGRADGTDLTPRFNLNEITERTIVVKSIKIVPYYFGVGVDISLDDGAGTVINEATFANQRINRLFDDFVAGTTINFQINGSTINFFPGALCFPLDLWIDNIMYKYPAKIINMNVQVLSSVINDLTTGALVNPNVKVMIECYLI